MANICEGCTTRYATGLAACPQCGSVHRHDEHEDPPEVSTVPVPEPDGNPAGAGPGTDDEQGEPAGM